MTAAATPYSPLDDLDPLSAPPTLPALRMVETDGSLTDLGRRIGVDVPLLRTLHRDMVLGRRLDTEALALQRQGELGLWLMAWGQEAAQAGTVRALREDDMVFPSYREQVAALARGITPSELLAQWRGVRHGGWERARFHLNSLVLGTQTLHATGYAQGVRLEGSDEVVMVYFGDGAASQGDVNEAMNWAAAGGLPIVFVCQNNQWAISTPTHLQMGTAPHRRAAGFGLHAFHVDGNDALAVHAVTARAVDLVRSGAGPAFVEAQTYRLAGHSSSDDPTRYRSPAELEAWSLRDPVVRTERLLRARGTDEAWFDELAAESDALALEVREACRALEAPDLDELFDHAYAGPHPLVERERAERRAYLSRLA